MFIYFASQIIVYCLTKSEQGSGGNDWSTGHGGVYHSGSHLLELKTTTWGKYSVPHLYPSLEKFWMIFVSRKCALTWVLGLYFISMLLCLYVNTCGYICLCVYICICTCIYIYRWSRCTCVHICVCVHLNVHMCAFIHMSVYLHMCICMCLYMCERILLLLTMCKSSAVTLEWCEGVSSQDCLSFILFCCSGLTELCLTASAISAGSWWASHCPPPTFLCPAGHWVLLFKGSGSLWTGCAWKGRVFTFTVLPATCWWPQEKAEVRRAWGQTKWAFENEQGVGHQ